MPLDDTKASASKPLSPIEKIEKQVFMELDMLFATINILNSKTSRFAKAETDRLEDNTKSDAPFEMGSDFARNLYGILEHVVSARKMVGDIVDRLEI